MNPDFSEFSEMLAAIGSGKYDSEFISGTVATPTANPMTVDELFSDMFEMGSSKKEKAPEPIPGTEKIYELIPQIGISVGSKEPKDIGKTLSRVLDREKQLKETLDKIEKLKSEFKKVKAKSPQYFV